MMPEVRIDPFCLCCIHTFCRFHQGYIPARMFSIDRASLYTCLTCLVEFCRHADLLGSNRSWVR